MYQQITIVGNLGGDPDLAYVGDEGVARCNFSVAANKVSRGEKITTWFRVTCWRTLAENCNQYLAKGRSVLVTGELNPDPATGGPRMWEDRSGEWRASYEVTAYNVKFLGGKDEAARDDNDVPF